MNKKTPTIYESKMYDMSFRATSNDLSVVKIYTNKNSVQIEKQISFDSDYDQMSSLDYFSGSVLSGILLSLLELSKKRGSIIEEIEGVLNLTLENPLSLAGVRGYEEEPFIRKIDVIVYLYVELDEQDFNAFCGKALKNSPLYNTLKDAMEIEVKFKKLV